MQGKYTKSKSKDPDILTPYYKLILIGENEVGKTQILHRLNDENFETKYSPTFGIDFRIKSIFGDKGKLLYDLQILDIAGETDEIHLKIENDFINDANAFLCLFDLSDDFSLDRAIKITEQYKSKINCDPNSKRWYLVGNKKDLDIHGKGVPYFYKAKFDNYFEVSCKTSKKEEFQKIIDAVTYDLNLTKKENDNIENLEDNKSSETFEIDFSKNHGTLFDEECNVF